MSAGHNTVGFYLDSTEDFDACGIAAQVIGAILDAPPFDVPNRYGQSDPIQKRIDPSDIRPLIDLWSPTPSGAATRGHGIREGLLLMESGPTLGYLVTWTKLLSTQARGELKGMPASISGWVPWSALDADADNLKKFVSLVGRIAGLVRAVYGEIHNAALCGSSLPRDIRTRLPDVPWLSVYGQPYIEMFGEDRIRNAPFHKIEQLPSGHYLLQATESIKEPVPESVRTAVRKHLGEDAFMSGGRWRYRHGRAPRFDLSNLYAK